MSCSCSSELEQALRIRRVRTRRGARARRGLIGHVRRLDVILGRSWDLLRRDLRASLKGRADDVHTGRLGQDDDEEIDPERLAAILLLISLWRRRHTELADQGVGVLFRVGRNQALRELGLATAPVSFDTSQLRERVLDQYGLDIDRLETALRNGSPRSPGLETIVSRGGTMAAALAAIDTLFRTERYRIDLFTESLTWTAWSEGYRAGAVDGAQLKLSEGEEPPLYRWSGPADSVTCGPCLSRFGAPVPATSLTSLPLPQSICAYGRACRHWWSLI